MGHERTIIFSCRSHTDSPDGETDIATLVRRALAEVYTVPVLLVYIPMCDSEQLSVMASVDVSL